MTIVTTMIHLDRHYQSNRLSTRLLLLCFCRSPSLSLSISVSVSISISISISISLCLHRISYVTTSYLKRSERSERSQCTINNKINNSVKKSEEFCGNYTLSPSPRLYAQFVRQSKFIDNITFFDTKHKAGRRDAFMSCYQFTMTTMAMMTTTTTIIMA
jgi:hypothetical protein